jgi:hypothetical protein
VIENRVIASVRAVVEQVNSRIKKQRIIESPPATEVPYLADWVALACGLANKCHEPYYGDAQDQREVLEEVGHTLVKLVVTRSRETMIPINSDDELACDHSSPVYGPIRLDSKSRARPMPEDGMAADVSAAFTAMVVDAEDEDKSEDEEDEEEQDVTAGEGGGHESEAEEYEDERGTRPGEDQEREARKLQKFNRARLRVALKLAGAAASTREARFTKGNFGRLIRFLAEKQLIEAHEATRLASLRKDELEQELLELVPVLEESAEYARFARTIDASLLPAANAARKVSEWVYRIYRPNLLSKRVRREWLRLLDDPTAPWIALTPRAAMDLGVGFKSLVIKFLFATPTVANSNEPYSTTYKRSHNFVGGATQMIRTKGVRLLTGWNGFLLASPCNPSMQSRRYDPIIGVIWPSDLPEGEHDVPLRDLKAHVYAFCTCKNGNDGGNCAHVVALARVVALLQHHESKRLTIVDRSVGGITHSSLGARSRAYAASIAYLNQ